MKLNVLLIFCVLNIFVIVNTCGVPKHKTGLIVNGQSFSRGDYPWIVALVYTTTSPPSFFCGGTIISSTFVISGKRKFQLSLGVK